MILKKFKIKTLEKKLKDKFRKDFCQNCGFKQEEGWEKLHVHHCYFANNKFNRLNYTSFVTLCYSCHFKTQQFPNFGGFGNMEDLEKYREHIRGLLTGEVFSEKTMSLEKLLEKIEEIIC